jgi:hypothetical protein
LEIIYEYGLTCDFGFVTAVASISGQQEDQRLKISAGRKDTGKVASTVLREQVQRSEISSRSQQKRTSIFKEWEGLVSVSPQAGPAKMCITEVDGAHFLSQPLLRDWCSSFLQAL